MNSDSHTAARVRLVLVGCGKHASIILHPALREIEEAEVVACCDLDPERARRAARGFGSVPHYTDLSQMLRTERADAAVVLSVPDVQPKLTVACLEAGLHVYSEKPLATTLSEAERIAETAKRTGKQVMVGFNKRFNPLYQRAKAVAALQEFGGPSMLDAKFVGGHRPSTLDQLTVGAVHLFDLGRFFMGDVREVVSRKCELRPGQVAFGVTLLFADGAVGVYNINSLSVWYTGGERVELVGNNNVIVVDNSRTFQWWKPAKASHRIGQTQDMLEEPTPAEYLEPQSTHVSFREWQTYVLNGYYGSLSHFVKCVGSGEPVSPGIHDGIEALRIALAVYEGANTGQAVKL
jgi:predicted dehydrogenase